MGRQLVGRWTGPTERRGLCGPGALVGSLQPVLQKWVRSRCCFWFVLGVVVMLSVFRLVLRKELRE